MEQTKQQEGKEGKGKNRKGKENARLRTLQQYHEAKMYSKNTYLVSDTWKCGSLSFSFPHPPEDLKRKKKENRSETESKLGYTIPDIFYIPGMIMM